MEGVIAGLLVAGVGAQWLSWRVGIPPIVFLLAGGLVAGPITGALDPDELLGDELFALVSVAVAVILFEGALGLGWRGVRHAGRTVGLLLTAGAAVTFATTMVAGRLLLDVSWSVSALIAAVLIVTGPTVIGPLVRSIRLEGRVGAILESEGTLIDPIGAIVTLFVFEALFAGHHTGGELVVELLSTLAVGAIAGLAGAGVLVIAFGRFLLPDELHNAATLAVVVAASAVANALADEAGLVAVTVMGIALASQRWVAVEHVLDFNVTLRIVFIAGLFLLLGARIDAATLRELEWRNVAFLAALVLVVRPLGVVVSTLGGPLSFGERVFLAATAPRGIVAAAVASVFSLRLAAEGHDGAQVVVSAVFTVIAGTVLLSGLIARPLAARLGLVQTGTAPIIVLGANEPARAVSEALERHGAPVRVIDLDRAELARARMSGLTARRGSVFDEATWEAADLSSASTFLAMTKSDELNVLASRHALTRIGRRGVFQVAPRRPEHRDWWARPRGSLARPLFDRDATLHLLEERLEAGWEVRSTPLTDVFGADDHRERYPGALPLFVVDGRGSIDVVSADRSLTPRPGHTLVALVPPTE